MFSVKSAFQVFVLLVLAEVQIESKTYYFSLNKTSNEYLIRTRLNSNSSYNYPSGMRLSELRNNMPIKNNSNEDQSHPLLDSEWDYNWKNITRPKLPTYIHKYYEIFSKNITGPVRFLFNAKPKNSTIMQYNVSDIDPDEDISEIELHFFHKVEKELLQKSLIIRLYQMENDYINETALINPDAHKLLNVIYVYQATSGWQVFKLTNTLHSSLKNRSDLSLFITTSKSNEENFSIFKDGNGDGSRTFLILKSESSDVEFADDSKHGINSNYCKRYNFPVDFNKLNWMHFIIAPSEYDAFSCYGTCYKSDEGLSNHYKVTKFAPEVGRKPLCCVPVEYSPLTIMFYDKKGNVVMKVYPDMIASVCGCR